MSDLRQWLKPELDRARIARQWAAIEAASSPRRARAWWLVPVVAIAIAIVALVVIRRPREAPLTAMAPAAAPTAFEVGGGAHVLGEPGADLVVGPNRVEVRSGAVELDVPHDPSRRFVVIAGAVTIVDVGTRFRVEVEPGRAVRVLVHEGAVRIEQDGRTPAELRAGESWSSTIKEKEPEPAVVKSAETSASARAVPPRKPTPREEAKRLFETGDAARLSGHPEEAARAFDALRARFRDDPSAGLAAMELGRLRQDVLHDPKGAEEAFRDAIALAPAAPFREDAEARRVAALEASGDRVGCAEARAGYLARYPSGLHAPSVSRRCAEK